MRGISIILYDRVQTGTDAFNAPVFAETPVTVDNILIGEPNTVDVINELQLSGKRLAYTLGIPKGDTHEWEDRVVEFYGKKFKTFGEVTQGIEHLVPTPWNAQVKVERYVG